MGQMLRNAICTPMSAWVKSGNAHNEPMKSAFHPIATEQRTQFYVGFVPKPDIGRISRKTVGKNYLAVRAGLQPLS